MGSNEIAISMKLVFVSNNAHKLKEISSILPEGIELIPLKDVAGDVEIEETASDLEGNAEIKANYVWDKYQMNSFADDTGLEVHALGNDPGVHSARYAGAGKNDEDNMIKLLSQLDESKDRAARFRTVICLIINGQSNLFEGIVNGKIATEKKGTNGFGYDPLFIPEGYNITFAEMESEDKNSLSHRRRAVDSFAKYINDNYK